MSVLENNITWEQCPLSGNIFHSFELGVYIKRVYCISCLYSNLFM